MARVTVWERDSDPPGSGLTITGTVEENTGRGGGPLESPAGSGLRATWALLGSAS